jgi:cellulose synthase/poly-beta-1,6-N-acetylglucosamine synthase-like glycosyltransferase
MASEPDRLHSAVPHSDVLNVLTDSRIKDSSQTYPFISVIIPIYNGAEDLPGLLSCLQAQSYPVDRVEYLIVDNNSQDQTLEILHSQFQNFSTINEAFVDKAFNVRVLQETIQSSYAARNTGIRAAKGEILAFTDADCRPSPNWLVHLVQPFHTPTVGLVAGEILPLPGDHFLERYADRHQTLSQRHTLNHPFSPYGQTANLAIRCSVVKQIGLFRPYLTTGGDADLCWRALRQSEWKIQFAELAIVYHRHRSTVAELCKQWRRYGESNGYLHQLHGVALTKSMTRQDYLYRWSRWCFKEVPMAIARAVFSSMIPANPRPLRSVIDALVDTPLDLLCRHFRTQGQQQAQLLERAKQIDWLASEELRSTDEVQFSKKPLV